MRRSGVWMVLTAALCSVPLMQGCIVVAAAGMVYTAAYQKAEPAPTVFQSDLPWAGVDPETGELKRAEMILVERFSPRRFGHYDDPARTLLVLADGEERSLREVLAGIEYFERLWFADDLLSDGTLVCIEPPVFLHAETDAPPPGGRMVSVSTVLLRPGVVRVTSPALGMVRTPLEIGDGGGVLETRWGRLIVMPDGERPGELLRVEAEAGAMSVSVETE